jgi:hypothetical protein
MQYKGLEITAFEETPGKWGARIVRANGKPLKGNHPKLVRTLASTNLPSAVDALTLALKAVHAAGLFFRNVDRERSLYPLARRKRRARRVLGQAGTDYILREQEMSQFIRRELWLNELLAATVRLRLKSLNSVSAPASGAAGKLKSNCDSA